MWGQRDAERSENLPACCSVLSVDGNFFFSQRALDISSVSFSFFQSLTVVFLFLSIPSFFQGGPQDANTLGFSSMFSVCK